VPVHDWALVNAGVFRHFHVTWIGQLGLALKGILPRGYYALVEQHLSRKQGDVLALHSGDPEELTPAPEPPDGGAVAVAEVPPKVQRTLVAAPLEARGRRTLTIRHTSGHRIIALVEILSPSTTGGVDGVTAFVEKAVAALRAGIHLVLVDLFPPGKHDPQGMRALIWEHLDPADYALPEGKSLTLASYAVGLPTRAYVEHLAVGDPLPDMPLFLTGERYVNLPLASTYEATFRGMPDFWRDVLEGRNPNGA
jgi:hypothetical protein